MPKCSRRPPRRLRLSSHQRNQLTDTECCVEGLRRRRVRRHHPDFRGRRGLRLRQGVNDRVTGSLALAAFAHEVAAKYPNITIALHTDTAPSSIWMSGCVLCSRMRPIRWHEARSLHSSRICGMAPPCRSRKIWTSPRNCSTCRRRRTPCWKSKSARSAVRKTVTPPKSMKSCIPLRKMASKSPADWVWANVAGTWPLSHSAMCMVPTSPAWSSCVHATRRHSGACGARGGRRRVA